MEIKALAVSAQAINYNEQFICNGYFTNAINFINLKKQLITLHRSGKGLSPMGWLLAEQDFDYVAGFVQLYSPIISSDNSLMLSSDLKLRTDNIVDLSVSKLDITQLMKITHLLPIISKDVSTGLYGALCDYKNIIKRDEPQQLICYFSRWLEGQPIDWQNYIGKGPGLTPSSDDMLIGMLFVVHACYQVKTPRLASFFDITPDLSTLTSSVSQSYLQYASQGIFSSYLKNIANKLANNEDILRATFELLTVGHHSGADTLLGIALGLCAVNQVVCKAS